MNQWTRDLGEKFWYWGFFEVWWWWCKVMD